MLVYVLTWAQFFISVISFLLQGQLNSIVPPHDAHCITQQRMQGMVWLPFMWLLRTLLFIRIIMLLRVFHFPRPYHKKYGYSLFELSLHYHLCLYKLIELVKWCSRLFLYRDRYTSDHTLYPVVMTFRMVYKTWYSIHCWEFSGILFPWFLKSGFYSFESFQDQPSVGSLQLHGMALKQRTKHISHSVSLELV